MTARLLGVVLSAVLLLALAPVAHGQQSAEVVVGPTSENLDHEGVKQGEFLRIEGSGLPEGDISSARLLGRDAQGDVTVQDINPSALNHGPPPDGGNYLQNNGGTLEGEILLGCVFGPPSSCSIPHDGNVSVQAEVRIAGQTFLSNGCNPAVCATPGHYPVDYIQPVVLRYDLTSEDTIVVVFSEPVRIPGVPPLNSERPADWRVRDPDAEVLTVSDGPTRCPTPQSDPARTCSRTLNLTPPISPDATPRVDYDANRTSLGDPYEDYAGNRIAAFSTLGHRAIDRIRPPIPEIDAIAGEAPSRDPEQKQLFSCTSGADIRSVQDSNVATPDLSLSGLVVGHELEIGIQVGNGSVTTITRDVDAEEMTIPLDRGLVPNAADITISPVAIDPNGNRSTQTGSPRPGAISNQPDGENPPLCYHLDTVPPTPLGASQVDIDSLQVSFTEVIHPDGGAGTFTIGGQSPEQVTGMGAVRRLDFAEEIPAGQPLLWEPNPDTYVDRVQLPLQWSPLDVVEIQPPGAPSFVLPPEIVTNAATIEVAGTAPADGRSLAVQLYADPDANEPIGDPIPVNDGRWSREVALPEGDFEAEKVTFYARTLDTDMGILSPLPPAQSNTVTVDRRFPSDVEITEPSSALLPGGEAEERGPGVMVVEWTARDAHPGNFDLTMVDAAGEAIPCSGPPWTENSDSYDGTCDVGRDVAAGNATITIVAIDAAGNDTPAESVPVPIDPDRLGATATLTGNGQEDLTPGEITVRYSQPVGPDTGPEEWRVSDGTQDDPANRIPMDAAITGPERDTVILDFAQPFPASAAHPNAFPIYEYMGPVLGDGLRGADGDPVPPSGPVFDVTPASLSVNPVPDRHNGLAAREHIPSCTGAAQQPPCPASGPVLLLQGQTDSAFDVDGDGTFDSDEYNAVAVYLGNATTGPLGPRLATAVVADDGSFQVIVPLVPNSQQTFTVVADDNFVNPFPGKPATLQPVTLIEDSLGPVVTNMFASLDARDDQSPAEIVVPMEFSEVASFVELAYHTGDGSLQPIETISINADAWTYRWSPLPAGVAENPNVVIRATAVDLVGNAGPPREVGLGNLPQLASAEVVDEDTVRVTTTEPVQSDAPGAAGFRVQGGPGVREVTADGTALTLELADPLGGGTYKVEYNGQGGWFSEDGRPLQRGSVTLFIPSGVLFPVTGLAPGPCVAGAALSFVDERNDPTRVVGYEIARNDEVVITLDADERIFFDPDLTPGTYTYTVTVVGRDGARSAARSVSVTIGPSPVPDDAKDAAIGGGTGAPPGAELLEDSPFPAEPNIGPDGGVVLSCDGRVAAFVPAGVAAVPMYGALLRRSTVPTEGFAPVTDLYQLIAVEASDTFPTVDAFDGYVELSYRDLRAPLDARVRERITALRPLAEARQNATFDEKAARVGSESVATHLITLGTAGVAQADGVTVRVFGPDPAIAADRFATAASLSQTQFARASTAVLARADDYPDALAAAPLAALMGGPVLLARTTSLPQTTLLELQRLGVRNVLLVGGQQALSDAVAQELFAAGFEVGRIAGPTRFHTAVEVARFVGSVDDRAFLATGGDFADALAASGPSAVMGRPILLTQTQSLTDVTLTALGELGLGELVVMGGPAAVGDAVLERVAAAGLDTTRVAGADRYATAVALAQLLAEDPRFTNVQPLLANGVGDGRTSPDALAGGPIAALQESPLLLVPSASLPPVVADYLAAADPRGIVIAGGRAAVSDVVRDEVDRVGGR